jgi:hypothetical protein
MQNVVDRIRRALGLAVRIRGAEYTDEYWGDIPAAAPVEFMKAVHVDLAGRTLTRAADDWDGPLKAAKARADQATVRTEPEQDWEDVIRLAKVRAAESAALSAPEEDWDALIKRAKLRAG